MSFYHKGQLIFLKWNTVCGNLIRVEALAKKLEKLVLWGKLTCEAISYAIVFRKILPKEGMNLEIAKC